MACCEVCQPHKQIQKRSNNICMKPYRANCFSTTKSRSHLQSATHVTYMQWCTVPSTVVPRCFFFTGTVGTL